jgi:hypothetical protein
MKNQNELFIVEHENGEWVDATGDGGWSCWTTLIEAQDALDSEADCRDDQRAAYRIIRFARVVEVTKPLYPVGSNPAAQDERDEAQTPKGYGLNPDSVYHADNLDSRGQPCSWNWPYGGPHQTR